MKRILTRNTIIAALLILMMALNVCAGSIDVVIERTLNGSEATQSLKITGNIDGCVEDELITLKIFPASLNESSLSGDDYVAFEQTEAKADGSYTIDCEFNEPANTYKLIVNSYNKSFSKELYISDFSAINQLISELNENRITNEAVVTKILSDNDDLSFDIPVFTTLSNTSQVKVIADMRAENSVFNIENIYESFAKHTFLNALNSASDTEKIKNALNYYDGKYINATQMSVNTLMNSLSENAKNEVYSQMLNKGFATTESVKSRLEEAVILSGYKNVASYLNLYDILDGYKAEIGITALMPRLSSNITHKNAVLRYLITPAIMTSVNSLPQLKDKIQYALDNINLIIGVDPTAPAGGGGGGGGGASSFVDVIPEKNDGSNSQGVNISAGLNDLSEAEWARSYILNLYTKGIISGKGDGTFKPNDFVTRGEIVKMLVMAAGIYDSKAKTSYLDLKGHWASSYVSSAANRGFVVGKSSDYFGVNENITREDAVVILYRMIQTSAKATLIPNVSNKFTDKDKMATYAVSSIEMLSEYGVVNGFNDGSFKPKNNLTRAEAAVLITNYLNFIAEED